jgi:predicted O-methyltransferase YrrM
MSADGSTPANDFVFTNNWFDITARGVWDILVPQVNPTRILEVGSFEGASAVYLINALGQAHDLDLHCIDTWGGGVEHQDIDMAAVESRFHHNTALATSRATKRINLVTHKGYSDACLAKLLAEGQGESFDLVYIDGSHQAPDVLVDAVLGFKLLKVGGVMIFDDYIWSGTIPRDPILCPKIAIDAFCNINARKLNFIAAPISQVYIQKIAS